MAYILGALWQSPQELQRRFAGYAAYLETIRARLPPSAYAFAAADWHYNPSDPRCPHDAWLEELCITEPATGDRRQHRTVDIRLRLLGAYHDGEIALHYRDVRGYTLRLPPRSADGPHGHGDWRDDEIRLSESGIVVHEIVFVGEGHLLIECADVAYRWLPRAVPAVGSGTAAGEGEKPPAEPRS